MNKSKIINMPAYYQRYINLVKEDDIFEGLQNSKRTIENYDVQLLKKIGDNVYQPGKWTIRDIFQHMIDTERIFNYRALRFARFDTTPLPAYDEVAYGQHAMTGKRTLEEILDEFVTLRTSTIQLFKSFDVSVFQNSGVFFNQQMSVLSIGFTIIGHQVHHLEVIKERYLPLVG